MRLVLPGSVLVGFAEFFDRAYGDPKTPQPYARVTPARVGDALLPFPCPHCLVVKPQVVDRERWDDYHDRGRGFSWCPSCDKRYVVDFGGRALDEQLPAGASSAPARVEWGNGRTELVGERSVGGLHMLGAH